MGITLADLQLALGDGAVTRSALGPVNLLPGTVPFCLKDTEKYLL